MTEFSFPLQSRAEALLSRNWLYVLATYGCVLLGLAYLVRVVVLYEFPVDFRYFWVTGKIWAEGGNPYDPSFSARALELWGGDVPFFRWLYAPHLWGPTRVLAMFSPEVAEWLWAGVSAVLIAIGTAIAVAAATGGFDKRWQQAGFGLLFLYTAVATPTAITIGIGQFSAFVYLGAAAFVYAVLRDNRPMMIVALIFVTMKPSIGLPFVAYALVAPRWRGALVIAGVISVVLAMPAFLTGPLELARTYLGALTSFADYASNKAWNITGARNLFFYATGIDLSGFLLAGLAALIAGALAIPVEGQTDPRGRRAGLALMLAASVFLVPLHLYDLIFVTLLVIGVWSPVFLVVWSGALLVMFRVNALSLALGIEEAKESGPWLTSLVLAVLLAAALFLAIRWMRRA